MQSNLDLHVYRYRSKFIFFTARLLIVPGYSFCTQSQSQATQISVGDLVEYMYVHVVACTTNQMAQWQCYMHCTL